MQPRLVADAEARRRLPADLQPASADERGRAREAAAQRVDRLHQATTRRYVPTVAFWTTRRMLDLGGHGLVASTPRRRSASTRGWAIAGVDLLLDLRAAGGRRRVRPGARAAAPLLVWAVPAADVPERRLPGRRDAALPDARSTRSSCCSPRSRSSPPDAACGAGSRGGAPPPRPDDARAQPRACSPASCCSSAPTRRCRARSSASAASRRSTRRRCTSGCGRGSTGFERDALTARAGAPHGRPGDADALDDPPRLAPRDYWPLALAVRDAAARVVAAGTRPRADRRRDGRGGETLARRAGGRPAAPGGDRGRSSASAAARRRAVARPRPRAAVRAPGSAAAPTSTRSAEDWVGPPPERGRARRRREHLVRRYLAASARRRAADIASLGGPAGRRRRAGARPARAARASPPRTATSCSTSRAPRCPPRHPGARALPPDLGRDAARPRPPRAASSPRSYRPRIFHTKTPQSVADVPRRRRGRRHVAVRRRRDRASSRSSALDRADERALRDEAERLAAFHA